MKILYISQRTTIHDRRFLQAIADGEYMGYFLRLDPEKDAGKKLMLPDGIQLVDDADLQGIVDRVQPDLIHAGPVPEGAYRAAKTGFHPLISMSWGSDLLLEVDKDQDVEARARYALMNSDLLLADCEAVKQKAVTLSFPEEKIVIFPWGIDLRRFQPGRNDTLREELGWDDKFVIFHSRSWEEVYGVDVVAKGFAEACKKDDDLRLLLLGGGSLKPDIEAIFEEAGVMDKVYFGGQVNQQELPAYYQAADLYLSASHSDGSSISLLEALASDLPALVTDIPGNREWVEPDVNGWLFLDGDLKRLAELILQAKDNNSGTGMSLVNRALVEDRADWTKNQKILLDAYRIFET